MKTEIKDDFKSHKCIELWHELWDHKAVTEGFIIRSCLDKVERLSKCDDVTPLEQRFIDMVNSWD